MPRSFSGRTKVFEAFYVSSIPALGAKLLLAWCTVHRGLINRFAPDGNERPVFGTVAECHERNDLPASSSG
jgi:hypothetical protein